MAVVAALSAGEALAQRGLPGQIAVGVSVGTTDGFLMRGPQAEYRFWCGGDAVRYNRNRTYWNFGAELLRKDYTYRGDLGRERVPMAQFTAEGGYYYKFLADPSRTFFFYLGGSALAGYESVNRGERRLYDGSTLRHRDRFLYGGAVTLEVDACLTDRIILSLTGRERILWGTTTGHFHAQFGLGVKFIIH